MNTKIFLMSLFITCTVKMYSQTSFSVNYLYNSGREKYTPSTSKKLVNHGVGIQSKICLKNRFFLMPDIAYFFPDYEKEYYGTEKKSFRETKTRYYAVNANLAYAIPLTKSFFILPFAGLGYLHENSKQYIHVDPSSPQEGLPITGGADVVEKTNAGSLPCNLGFNMDYYLSKNIFVTGGIKYMIDIYDTKYNCFPYVNIGIGHSF